MTGSGEWSGLTAAQQRSIEATLEELTAPLRAQLDRTAAMVEVSAAPLRAQLDRTAAMVEVSAAPLQAQLDRTAEIVAAANRRFHDQAAVALASVADGLLNQLTPYLDQAPHSTTGADAKPVVEWAAATVDPTSAGAQHAGKDGDLDESLLDALRRRLDRSPDLAAAWAGLDHRSRALVVVIAFAAYRALWWTLMGPDRPPAATETLDTLRALGDLAIGVALGAVWNRR